jgi:ABC-type uncharacterized transport system auxiliary subunit
MSRGLARPDRWWRIGSVAVAAALAAGCGPTTVPVMRHYTLRAPRATLPPSATGPRLEVADFVPAPGWSDPRMAYRVTPFELRFDPYRRWVADPPRLLAHVVAAYLRASGAFGAVEPAGHITGAAGTLIGVVEGFEEVASGTESSARLALTFHLRRGDRLVRVHAFDRTERCKQPTADGVAEILSDILAAEMPALVRALAQAATAE